MEWLRSCYSSKWFLFAGDGHDSIPGRYYFSPENNPFYAGFHHFNSQTWADSNWKQVQSLGEDLSSSRSYDSGSLPTAVPGNLLIGSTDCIEFGEVSGGGVPASTLVDGFPPGAFVPQMPRPTFFEEASEYLSRSIQYACARVIEWLYQQENTLIDDYLFQFLGSGFTTAYQAPSALLPSVYIVKTTSGTLVFVDGTVNFQQLALQSAYGLIMPLDFGIFSTSPFWYRASTYIHNTLNASGVDGTLPIFFSGHSFGAVACLILCARYRVAHPERTIKYLTFGCPRIGDDRLESILQPLPGLSLCNNNDLVAAIPPDYSTLFPVWYALLVPGLLNWPAWKPAPWQAMLMENGSLVIAGIPTIDMQSLLAFAEDVVAGVPYPDIAGHSIILYRQRLFDRSNVAVWPLTAIDYVYLAADLEVLLLEDQTPFLLEAGGMAAVIVLE